jgi:ribosomal protein S18 acetylase RimI-like enzyme
LGDHIRLRRVLDGPIARTPLPSGVALLPLFETRPNELHALLRAAYATGGGSVGSFDEWWWPLVEDEEFHPDLVATAAVEGRPVGLVQCWTSGFIKDIVVAPDWRNRSLGSGLLTHAFAVFAARGAPHVDLKVEAENFAAQRFYQRHGMVAVEAP